jgi:hypothetical protein
MRRDAAAAAGDRAEGADRTGERCHEAVIGIDSAGDREARLCTDREFDEIAAGEQVLTGSL